MKEALTLALEALKSALSDDQPYIVKCGEAITAIKEALAQPKIDPWREAVAQPERDPWREAVAQPEERNFCPRCGKRTADIHTCTPPQ